MEQKNDIKKLFGKEVKSRRQLRLVRGQLFKKARRSMSPSLADSVIRTWERKQKNNLPY